MLKTPLESWIQGKISNTDGPAVPLTRSCLDAYQLRKIRETLVYVRENSSFYRQWLSDAETDTLQRFADMARLPFTTSYDLKRHPLRFLCVSPTSH